MGDVKYWDGEDFTVLDSKNAQSVNGIKFRINVDILEYSNDGLTWNATSVSKADIGLGNVDNTSDLSKPISTATQTALDSKVDNSRVLTDVPLNAKFTDTITTINNKTGVITKADIVALGIPSADTNTITTINGKTGAILKADIVALGVPAQDTIYTHPTGTNPHGTTKSDVGLGNVTNDKQMPIAGGTFTGIATAQSNTSYTVRQMRNIILSTGDAVLTSMQDGDIWIKYV